MTSYLTSIDTFFLSRTVFEIFDFKVIRVWLWPLTFRGQLGSKIVSPFESSYLTSYLTSIDTFFLSHTVFEIFDFKVIRVRPWPYTFKGQLGSKIFSPFESSDFSSYRTSIDTLSLYLVPFLIISNSKVLGFDLTFDLWRATGVKKNFTIRKPIHDFPSNFYEHFLSISYRFRDIRLQSF